MNADILTHLPILADAGAAPTGLFGMQLLPMLLIFAGMWFLMIAPARKRQKKHAAMVAALGTGDEVMTNSGIYGTITNVKDDRFVLKVADNTKIEIAKAFVQNKANEDAK